MDEILEIYLVIILSVELRGGEKLVQILQKSIGYVKNSEPNLTLFKVEKQL